MIIKIKLLYRLVLLRAQDTLVSCKDQERERATESTCYRNRKIWLFIQQNVTKRLLFILTLHRSLYRTTYKNQYAD